jgi:hypothetical protein
VQLGDSAGTAACEVDFCVFLKSATKQFYRTRRRREINSILIEATAKFGKHNGRRERRFFCY